MKNKRYIRLAVIALAAAGLRAAYAWLPRPEGDGGLYLLLADKILAGEYFFSLSGDSFPLLYRTPVYPAFLALVSFLPGSVEGAAAAVQRLLGLLTAFLVYRIALLAWGSRAAAAGGALFAAAHFHFLYFEAYPLSETLAVFLACASVYYVLALRPSGRPAARDLALGGLIAGCAGMCRPELFAAAGLGAWYLLAEDRTAAPAKAGRAAVYLLPVLLLAGGWTLRNWLLYDYPGLTPNSAITFFSGPAGRSLQPEDVGADFVGVQALKYRDSQGLGNRAVSALEKEGVPYQWTAARLGELAAGAAVSRPAAYLRASLRQLKELLFPRGDWPPSDITETIPDLFSTALNSGTGKVLSALGRADWFAEKFILPWLFLAGALVSFRRGSSGAGRLLAALPLGLLVIYAFLSPVSARYRVIAEPFMGLLAARAAQLLYLKLKGGAPAPAAEKAGPVLPARFTLPVLAAGGCLFVFFIWGVSRAYQARSRPLTPETSSAGAAQPAGPGYLAMRQGRYPEALKLFDAALAGGRDKAAADGRAEALFRMGRGREALAGLEETLRLNPGSADTLYNIGRLNFLSGETGAAVQRLSEFMERPGAPLEPRLRAAAMLAELRSAK